MFFFFNKYVERHSLWRPGCGQYTLHCDGQVVTSTTHCAGQVLDSTTHCDGQIVASTTHCDGHVMFTITGDPWPPEADGCVCVVAVTAQELHVLGGVHARSHIAGAVTVLYGTGVIELTHAGRRIVGSLPVRLGQDVMNVMN